MQSITLVYGGRHKFTVRLTQIRVFVDLSLCGGPITDDDTSLINVRVVSGADGLAGCVSAQSCPSVSRWRTAMVA